MSAASVIELKHPAHHPSFHTLPRAEYYNDIQASCSGKTRDTLIRAFKVPELCCNTSSVDTSAQDGGRRALKQSTPSVAPCPSAGFPLLGQCQYTTGMIVYVSVGRCEEVEDSVPMNDKP